VFRRRRSVGAYSFQGGVRVAKISLGMPPKACQGLLGIPCLGKGNLDEGVKVKIGFKTAVHGHPSLYLASLRREPFGKVEMPRRTGRASKCSKNQNRGL